MGRPILTGNLAHMRPADIWYNGVFLIHPERGLVCRFLCAKRVVSFGNLRLSPLPHWLSHLVLLAGSFRRGTAVDSFRYWGRNGFWLLVCYEDMFHFEYVNRLLGRSVCCHQ